MKRTLIFLFYLLLAFATTVSGGLLYFGRSDFYTTILLYVLLCTGAIKLIDLLNNRFKAGINPNMKILVVSAGLSLLGGEWALRYVFKKNITYSENIDAVWRSYYSYVNDWESIKKYLFKKPNYWYLKGEGNGLRGTGIGNRYWEHRYNSQGFREDDKPPQSDDPQQLIIGIGDSFAEGIGTDVDSTWLRFMARNLNAGTDCNIRTYNAGAQGSDVFFEYLLLEQLLQLYHPNTVVLGINSSDVDDIIMKGGRNRFKPNGGLQFNRPPWWERLYGASLIVRGVIHATGNRDWTLLTRDEKKIKQQEAIDSIEFSVRRFQELAQQKGFNLVVAFHPREFELVRDEFALDSLADKLALDTTLNVVNLKRRFIETGFITKRNAAQYYWKVDLHHNTEGYKIMGGQIADFIRSKQLLCAAKK